MAVAVGGGWLLGGGRPAACSLAVCCVEGAALVTPLALLLAAGVQGCAAAAQGVPPLAPCLLCEVHADCCLSM